MYQQTIKKEIHISGVGLHSGKIVNMTIKPAKSNHGIIFHFKNKSIKSDAFKVINSPLCTLLKEDDVEIKTIEHFMFSLYFLNIDNVNIYLDSNELPILDGSAAPFIFEIKQAGLKKQFALRKFIKLKKEVSVKFEDKYIIAKPNHSIEFDIKIDFPDSIIGEQHINIKQQNKDMINSVSKARTFCFAKDIEYMRNNNLALGGSLDNAVIIDEFSIINKEGLRDEQEFVLHKTLDFIGDLYVNGFVIIAKFEGYKTGHLLNNLLLKEILSNKENYSIIEFDNPLNDYLEKLKQSFKLKEF